MTKRRSAIKFNYLKPIYFPQRTNLKLFITSIFHLEHTLLDSLSYIFCSDAYLLHLNQHFLSHDTFTDVITFTLSEKGNPVIGEIYISIDRIIDNAKLFNISFLYELYRVMFHGALHLCGFDDKSVKDKKIMTFKENSYLFMYTHMFPRGTL